MSGTIHYPHSNFLCNSCLLDDWYSYVLLILLVAASLHVLVVGLKQTVSSFFLCYLILVLVGDISQSAGSGSNCNGCKASCHYLKCLFRLHCVCNVINCACCPCSWPSLCDAIPAVWWAVRQKHRNVSYHARFVSNRDCALLCELF